MRWRGRRQSSNIEDRRGLRVTRGGMVGGGIGTIALVLLAMYLGVDPAVVMQGVGTGGVETTEVPYTESPNEAQWREETATVLASTEDAWNARIAELGGDYREPTLVLFSGAVEAACGFAEAAMGPFYCPTDQKVYIDLSFFDQLATQLGARGDAPRAYVIAHEVGHHVQNLFGETARVHQLQQRVDPVEANQLSVRLELQADCYAGLWTQAAGQQGFIEPGDVEEALAAASAIGDDTLQRSAGRAVVPDSFTHGSAEQRQRWFMRGYESATLEGCDTFKAADL
jgi:uncharacterized protein